MGYARYIGRVGALAVALGIGVALANGPATAWADGDDGSSSGPSSASDSSAGADAQSDTSGSAGSTGASGDASTGDVSVGADGGEDDAAKEDADDDESTDPAKSGADDAAARDDSTSGAGQPAAVRKGSRVSQRESVTSRKSEVKVRAEAGPSAKRSSAATTVSNTPTAGAGGTAPQAVSVSETRRSVPISTPVRSADVVDVSAVSTTPSAPAKTVTTAVLSALGLSPLATGGPTDVPESPVAWATFAALRRQTDEDAGTEQKLLSVADPVASTLSVEDELQPMMAMAAAVNGAPSASPVVGSPDQVSGAVSVALNAVDPDGNPLSYTVTSAPAGGTVAVAGASVTYTPTVAARLAAGSTAGADFDSFLVEVSDGQASTPVSVSVPVLPAVWVNAPQVSNVTGASPYGVALVGSAAYVANQGTNTVSVINTLTGQSVGSPIVVGSAPTGVVASPDGAYVYVANRTSGTVSVIRTSNNTVVDINPGTTAIDSIMVGSQPEMIAVNTSSITTASGIIAKGARLYVTNYASGTVSVIDVSNPLAPKLVDTTAATPKTVDAIKVGTNPRGIAFAQVPGAGPRLYVVNRGSGSVSVIDAVTNKVIDANPATATTVDAITVGSTPQQIAISPDGKTAYVTNYGSTSVSIIDTVTNKLVDAQPSTPAVDAIAVRSTPAGVAVSADGSVVYVANGDDRVSVIDAKTRTVVNTLQIDTQTETNFHTMAVRADGSLMVTDFADRALRRVTFQRGNTAPVALAAPTVDDPNPVDGAVSGLVNIKDWDGDPLSYSTVSGPTRGSVSFDPAAGTYTYTPTQAARDAAAQNPGLTDTFTIRATEQPTGASVTTTPITVTLLPTPVSNRAPQAGTPSVGEPDRLAGAVSGLLNFTDPDNNPMTYSVPVQPSSGTVTLNGSSYTYGPSQAARAAAAVSAGPDVASITVVASDGQSSTPVTFSVPVIPPNRAPTPGTPSVGNPVTATGAVTGSLNFTDPDNDSMSYSAPVQPAGGSVTVTGSTYTYTPTAAARAAAAASQGEDLASITVVANDGLASGSVTFSVPISPTPPANSAPTASPSQGVPNQSTGAIAGAVNGADVDGNPLSYTLTGTPPARGSVTVNPTTGAFTYAPTQLARFAAHDGGSAPDFDSFTVAVSDGQVSTPVTVQVAVLPAWIPSISSTAQTGANPMGMAVSPTKTYVANQQSNTVSVIDRANPMATPTTVNVVAAPRAIALSSDGTRAYVAGNGGVSVINTATNQVITTVATSAGDSYGIAVSPSANGQHRVYVTNAATNTVRVINADTTTNTYTAGASVTVGTAPRGIAVSADGSRAYVTNWNSNNVSVLNTSTATPTLVGSPITVGINPIGVVVSPDGNRVYVANYGSASVSVLNPAAATPLVTTVAVGSQPFGLAITPDGSIVYAANAWDDVSMIHTRTNTVYSTLTIDDQQPEPQWHSVAVSPDGRQVYMSDMADRTVRVATIIRSNTAPAAGTPTVAPNPTTGEVTGVVNVKDYDGDSITVTYSQPSKGSVSYNASTGAYTYNPTAAARVQAFSTPGMTDTFTVSATDSFGAYKDVSITVPVIPSVPAGVTPIAVGSNPIDITAAGNRLYVTNSGDGSVSVIDTTTNRVINTIGGLGYASPTVASSDGRYLYVSQYDSYYVTASVKVVDTVTRSVVATVTMPRCEAEGCDVPGGGWANSAGITDIAISPDNSRVYVSELWVGDSFYGGTITMIDTATNTIVGSTSTSQWGDFYSNIEVTPDGTRLYAGSGYPYYPQMDVLDARTLARVGTVPLDGHPGWPPLSMGSLTFSPNGERAYARTTEYWPTETSQTFAVIDTKPGSPTYNTQIATITVPPGAQYLKVSPDNSRAYVVHNGGKTVTVINTVTNAVIGSIASSRIGGDYAALAVGANGLLYFSNYQANAVYAVAASAVTTV